MAPFYLQPVDQTAANVFSREVEASSFSPALNIVSAANDFALQPLPAAAGTYGAFTIKLNPSVGRRATY